MSLNKELNSIASIILFTRQTNFIMFSIEDLYSSNIMQGNLEVKQKNWGISVRVGDSGHTYPETLWSSIQLNNYLSTEDTYDFQFDSLSELAGTQKDIKRALLEMSDYLQGDLRVFYMRRAEMVEQKNIGYIEIEDTKTGEKQTEINNDDVLFKNKYGSRTMH